MWVLMFLCYIPTRRARQIGSAHETVYTGIPAPRRALGGEGDAGEWRSVGIPSDGPDDGRAKGRSAARREGHGLTRSAGRHGPAHRGSEVSGGLLGPEFRDGAAARVGTPPPPRGLMGSTSWPSPISSMVRWARQIIRGVVSRMARAVNTGSAGTHSRRCASPSRISFRLRVAGVIGLSCPPRCAAHFGSGGHSPDNSGFRGIATISSHPKTTRCPCGVRGNKSSLPGDSMPVSPMSSAGRTAGPPKRPRSRWSNTRHTGGVGDKARPPWTPTSTRITFESLASTPVRAAGG